MFKKISLLFFAVLFLLSANIRADEGMWLLSLVGKVKYAEMKKMGLKLSPEDIYSLNKSSLKDAIVSLDKGSCTAEIVSKNGLLLTNHHCGYEDIQSHSSIENDYLTNGFWAKSYAEELPNEGKTATLLVRMEDVTEKIVKELNDEMSQTEREEKIRAISDELAAEAIGETHYEAEVKSFFEGNRFYLFVFETFKDIRLVGAPPESIGKFGHDTDNWMWPRHTGDFSIFRIYCAPDGKPADYSKDNVPYTPKHHLPISLKGVHKGDFAMVIGFPGTTERFLTSFGVEETIDDNNPIRIKVRDAKQKIMTNAMNADEKVRIQYAAKYAQSSNYWKYSIGQNKGLKRLKVIDKKKDLEKALEKWINADKSRKEKYAEALPMIKKAYADRKELNQTMKYILEAFLNGPEVIMFAYQGIAYSKILEETFEYAAKEEIDEIKKEAQAFFKDYDPQTDKKIMIKLFQIFKDNVEKEYHPEIFQKIDEKYEGSFEAYADDFFAKSIFTDQERFNNFLDKPSLDKFFEEIMVFKMAFFGKTLQEVMKEYPKNVASHKKTIDGVIAIAAEHFQTYDKETDKKDFVELLEKYSKNIPQDKLPEIFTHINEKYKGDFNKYADYLFENTIFTDRVRFEKAMSAPQHNSLIVVNPIFQLAEEAIPLQKELSKANPDKETVNKLITKMQGVYADVFKDFDKNKAKETFVETFNTVYKNASSEQKPSIYKTIESKYKGNVTAFANDLFNKSIFTNQNKMFAFFAKPKAKDLSKDLTMMTLKSLKKKMEDESIENDPAYVFFKSINPFLKIKIIESDPAYLSMFSVIKLYYQVNAKKSEFDDQLDEGKRLFVDALMKKEKNKDFYPDANSTIRLTYGQVGDYEPRDAVEYKYYTSLKGVMEKEDASNPEFVVSEKLKELYDKKDYGNYAYNKDEMRVCFTTNNDITGGNSGSPVLNGKGQLIGIAFDGNWEAMSGDITFEPVLQKCINVDIKYVLFIIDKYAGAKRLIDEMTILK
ncbi:MAG: hypothetical protein CSB01_01225 [Bacteroidia bacterium]|nr:MAG: hypothetical protein CSB01_01225 [Bacteroidia bacterium]